jgi:hypothetical protein
MGLRTSTWNRITDYLKMTGFLKGEQLPMWGTVLKNEGYYQKEMLELGCQVLRGVKLSQKSRLSSKYFNSIGIKCLSVDLQKCGEAVQLDLRDPFPDYFCKHFDIVTNAGTTEHVETEDGQYEAFKNIHFSVKSGGIMIHIVPIKEKCRHNHSPYYYSNKFFEVLSNLNNYKIIKNEEYNISGRQYYCGVCLQKINDDKFTENKEEFLKYIDLN